MPPHWLIMIADVFLTLSVVSALAIVFDILGGRRQMMRIMEVAWPITALYFGPFTLWAYYAFGRSEAPAPGMHGMSGMAGMHGMGRMSGMHHEGTSMASMDRQKVTPENPAPRSIFLSATHCGAGCVLGDIIGEWTVFLAGWAIAGQAIWADYIADFLLAFLFGIAFQYFSIVPMRHLSPGEGLRAALKADTLSILAFEVGMFAWMAFARFALFRGHPLQPNQAAYWFMMQIGMVAGFLTTYPVNRWLIRQGVKEPM